MKKSYAIRLLIEHPELAGAARLFDASETKEKNSLVELSKRSVTCGEIPSSGEILEVKATGADCLMKLVFKPCFVAINSNGPMMYYKLKD